jgi:two-component system, NtrC family, response regulator
MSSADQVAHPALAASAAAPALEAARLTDRQRIAVLLEGAGLLSLLERAGWWLPRGWAAARVSPGDRLLLPPGAASPGRSPRPPQEQLRELLLRLFGAAAAAPGTGAASPSGDPVWDGAATGSSLVAGRGEARRAARTLLGDWWQTLVPVPADEAVAQILAAAPFLWQPAFATARRALAGELRGGAAAVAWVAGPSASRARLLSGGAGMAEAADRLGGAAARSWWEGPVESAGAGSAAVAGTMAAGAGEASARPTAGAGAETMSGAAMSNGVRENASSVSAATSLPDTTCSPATGGSLTTGTAATDRAGAAGAAAGRERVLPQSWRWRNLVAAARSQRPATDAARLQLAAALAGLGRSAAALDALAPCRSPPARLLRVRCLVQLGRLGAARAGLRRVEALPLAAGETIEAAELAVRVFANSGEPEPVRRWIERALAAGATAPDAERARARLVAAVAAWDRQEPAAMEPHLEAAGAALGGAARGDGAGGEIGQLSAGAIQALWRWEHARALRAMAEADGAAVVDHLARALRHGRRLLSRHDAAGLWNDLGIGRVQTGDLAGAERAFLHSLRLFGGCDGPRRTTLALHNLAEVRLRRGRIAGVREILARSAAEDRRGGNLRGLTEDAEVGARLELVLGRPEQAAALCRTAMERLDRRRSRWRREVLGVLLARALGWLERPGEAAGELAQATPAAVAELEPEERPALWAHAGDRAAARRSAMALGSATGALWQAVLAGEAVAPRLWDVLAGLEPYRAARLVFDLERAAAGALMAPTRARRQAIATFRHLGASAMADWLEAREAGPWQALAAYAARPAGDLQAIAELLRRAGDPSARLSWNPAPEPGEVRETSGAWPSGGWPWRIEPAPDAGPPQDSEPAPGAEPARDAGLPPEAGPPQDSEPAPDAGAQVAGPAPLESGSDGMRLVADLPAGRVELRCRRLDPALTACFALAVRDLAARGAQPATVAAGPAPAAPWQPPEPQPSLAAGRPPELPPPLTAAGGLIGSSPTFRATLARLARVAAVDIPVLIRGESGTGKELAARAIHAASTRAHGTYIPVNCAALAESLLLSDLFGHVRGAFTGADRDRVGVFETARGGTVLLDEIGDLPLAAQGLLLRVLQEGEVRRLGESLPRRVNVRVLAATHRDLEQGVRNGTFREDLFYRLKVGAVDLPPLRDRGDDVQKLAEFFLSRLSPSRRLSLAARERLRAHGWPGNVRELDNVLRLAAALAGDGTIEVHHLEMPAVAPAAPTPAGSYHQQVEDLRRQLVRDAIAAAAGNHAEAARRLGISRQALSYLVKQLGLR